MEAAFVLSTRTSRQRGDDEAPPSGASGGDYTATRALAYSFASLLSSAALLPCGGGERQRLTALVSRDCTAKLPVRTALERVSALQRWLDGWSIDALAQRLATLRVGAAGCGRGEHTLGQRGRIASAAADSSGTHQTAVLKLTPNRGACSVLRSNPAAPSPLLLSPPSSWPPLPHP